MANFTLNVVEGGGGGSRRGKPNQVYTHGVVSSFKRIRFKNRDIRHRVLFCWVYYKLKSYKQRATIRLKIIKP